MADIYDRLIRFNQEPLPENFIAIGGVISGGRPNHAVIIIRHLNINYLYHFPGKGKPVIDENFTGEDGIYVYKMLQFFKDDDNEVGAILQHCRRICRKSEIKYSFILDGSTYDHTGDYHSESGLPEFGTCVGFCVTTLASIIIESDKYYFNLDDWPPTEVIEPEYLYIHSLEQATENFPELDWSKYHSFQRRITPLEYLCSAYVTEYPILKREVDAEIFRVLDEIDALL